MNKALKKCISFAAAALGMCAAPSFLSAEPLWAADLQSMTAIHASDKLTVTPSGNVCYLQGNEAVTGKFSLEPNFLIGDVNNDKVVNAADAASLLEVAAALGSADNTAAAESFFEYADADENGEINASDAALILSYAAASGGDKTYPLGFSFYYADKNGILQTGRIDTASGETYIAGEDYKLMTGWVYFDGGIYLLDNEGVMQKNTWAVSLAGKRRWLGANGAVTMNSWADTDEGRCYLLADGTAADGMQTIGGDTFYFENNLLQTGWLTLENGVCYAGEDGALYQGMQSIDGDTYCFSASFAMLTGWVEQEAGSYYFGEDGKMQTGWLELDGASYYLSADGRKQTGLVTVDGYGYYLDENGIRQTGFQNISDAVCYFYPETGHMATGFVYLDAESAYYFGENGIMATGWQTVSGDSYYFGEDGVMTTGIVNIDGVIYQFDETGICLGEYVGSLSDTDIMLNTANRSEMKRSITVYDQQKGTGKELVDFTFKLSDADIAIIEQFAAENFPANATLAEKLYITHQWIHYNVDYAYAGAKWNEIVNLSYVDAIFNHKKGQCVQYNGAMASVLAYYGFDVYMVKGWTKPGTQHFWTEVELNGHTYMVETGNSGKNGDWWQYFFKQMD